MIASPTDNQGPIEKPDRKVLSVWLASSSLTYGIFLLFVLIPTAIVAFIGKPPVFLALNLIPISLWALSAFSLKKQWESWTFRLGPDTLEMTHGWIWRQSRVVARDRIQHIDINSGPFDRRFGLVQVVVYTAGTTVGMIPGLRPERANSLRDELMVENPPV